MVFSWFSTRQVDAFVDAEVAELTRRAPPPAGAASGAAPNKHEAQRAKAHDLLLRHATDFARREKPNLFQKARLANRVKWALSEAGYPKAFVDDLAYALAAVVAAAGSDREI